MNNTFVRLYIVAAIVAATHGLSQLAGIAIEPPEVEVPEWKLENMPKQFGAWKGEKVETDPEIFSASDASVIEDRLYGDDENHQAIVHTAMFPRPDDGVYHNPLNCYRTHGWKKLRDDSATLNVADDLSIPVNLTVWEQNNRRVMVVYWYQLGERILHERWDLGKARLAMRGQEKWPVLLKVMVQTDFRENSDTEQVLLGFTTQLAQWLNSPEHRKYLGRWGGAT